MAHLQWLYKTIFIMVAFSGIFAARPEIAHSQNADEIYNSIINNWEVRTSSGDDFEDELEALSKINTEHSRQLLVNLQDFYLGAYNSEKLSEIITREGPTMKCMLKNKLTMPVVKNRKKGWPKPLTKEERNENIHALLEAINKGMVLWAEYPDTLIQVANWDIGLIKIAIEKYKLSYSRLPNSLDELGDFVEKSYFTKLRIYDPWGEKYKYNKMSENSYNIESSANINSPSE